MKGIDLVKEGWLQFEVESDAELELSDEEVEEMVRYAYGMHCKFNRLKEMNPTLKRKHDNYVKIHKDRKESKK